MKTKILVVEDEIIIADNLCSLLEGKGFEIFDPVVSYLEAIESIVSEKPDIIFLDIRLKGSKTGIDLAKEIDERFNIPFVFLTSHSDDETMEEAIKTNPAGFLTKPFRIEDILAAIKIASLKKSTPITENKFLFVSNGKEKVKVFYDDILYLKSENVYVEFYLRNRDRIVVRSTLKKTLEELDGRFFQIHKSFLVNIKNLDKVSKATVTLGQFELPIGDKYCKKFRIQLNSFLDA